MKDTKFIWCQGDVNTSGPQLATFLNVICDTIMTNSGKKALREWNTKHCYTPLQGSLIIQKPDVILVDHNFKGTPQWHNVHAVAELTTSASKHLRIIRTVTDKSYIMLGVQPSHVFTPIISAWGGSKFHLTITNRQGQLCTSTYNTHGGICHADLHVLIHIVAGLCFGSDKAVGYDDTMKMGLDGVEVIMCAGDEFKVINLIYATQSLIS